MKTAKERILVVESEPDLSDLIARQTLIPSGFRVQVATSVPQALQEITRFIPDVIIADLKLPGLSGKDLLVALGAQTSDVPVIVIAEKGMEGDVIQAFRLGAADFLAMPLREAEIVSAVERGLKQVRARYEREALSRQLNHSNLELQRRVRELTTIFAMGKAVLSVTDKRTLMDKIVEGAVYVAEADAGWLVLRDEHSKTFVLSAQRNLPRNMAAGMNQPWDDGLSALVAQSGTSLAIHGEPLKRFRIASLGQAALVAPLKIKQEVLGLLAVVRKAPQPMGPSSQALLEAVADYAAIALVNAHLFNALEDRARQSERVAGTALIGEQIVDAILQKASSEQKNALGVGRLSVDRLLGSAIGKLNVEQTNAVITIRDQLKNLLDIANAMEAVGSEEAARPKVGVELIQLVRQCVMRFQSVAHNAGQTIVAEFPRQHIRIEANALQIAKVVDALLSNAIRHAPQGGQITVRVEYTADGLSHVAVMDKGPGIPASQIAAIFDKGRAASLTTPRRFGGLAIDLPLAREIITAHQGKLWAESKPGAGATFHFTLPAGIN
jgi:signal transduction histidine kinase